jgi:cobalt/nickel transport protein
MARRTWPFVVAALALALTLAAFIAPFASSAPDGLDKVAQDQGFEARAEGREVWTRAPMPDYKAGGVSNTAVAKGIAGVAGTLAVFAVAFAIGKLLASRRTAAEKRTTPP